MLGYSIAAAIAGVFAVIAAIINRDSGRRAREMEREVKSEARHQDYAKRLDKIAHDTANLRQMVPVCCRLQEEDATHLRDFMKGKN